ncbi:hypothetical protein ASE95_04100 [Sphingomonas sp. Leaf231]|uniref:hypothetical protein n=1 Tax=Sphingomonas sp. Leaf231 TaxID=1736301 RepID=UPI0006F265B6|nr:hypothetical protein [Sphingomonas sp. Leaf231]KQN94064.1 hypothetical protein ASE95_04100 [Sphingomonas sp. Leaf231]
MNRLLAALLACALPAAASAETLTNATVITLVKAGLGDEAVLAKIKATPGQFDLSTDQIIALKQQGVSSAVIAAMLAAGGNAAGAASASSIDSPDWRVPHPAGIYLLKGTGDTAQMARIDPTTANQTKTGGMLGYMMTGGIASIKMKSVVPNARARIRGQQPRPEFFFYFDEANSSLSHGANTGSFLAGPTVTTTSPNEFSLIRFDVKQNRREARVGSFNIAGSKTGVMDKDRIAFSYDRVAPGVFRVRPDADLAPGEYGFLYSMSAGSGSGMYSGGVMTARVFDFAVGD